MITNRTAAAASEMPIIAPVDKVWLPVALPVGLLDGFFPWGFFDGPSSDPCEGALAGDCTGGRTFGMLSFVGNVIGLVLADKI